MSIQVKFSYLFFLDLFTVHIKKEIRRHLDEMLLVRDARTK
jgi:hypothetical protein